MALLLLNLENGSDSSYTLGMRDVFRAGIKACPFLHK